MRLVALIAVCSVLVEACVHKVSELLSHGVHVSQVERAVKTCAEDDVPGLAKIAQSTEHLASLLSIISTANPPLLSNFVASIAANGAPKELIQSQYTDAMTGAVTVSMNSPRLPAVLRVFEPAQLTPVFLELISDAFADSMLGLDDSRVDELSLIRRSNYLAVMEYCGPKVLGHALSYLESLSRDNFSVSIERLESIAQRRFGDLDAFRRRHVRTIFMPVEIGDIAVRHRPEGVLVILAIVFSIASVASSGWSSRGGWGSAAVLAALLFYFRLKASRL